MRRVEFDKELRFRYEMPRGIDVRRIVGFGGGVGVVGVW